MGKYKVSVIIPAYNASSSIGPCIQSVLAQTSQAHEIIIVNDASTDDTAEIVRSMSVRLIDREKNGGAGTARAEGARVATGDILAFTDSDCVVPTNWTSQIIEAFESEPELGGVGGIYKTTGAIKSSTDLLCFFEEEYIQAVNCTDIYEAHPPGGNMAYLKEVWDKGRSGLELQLFQGIASGEDTLVSSELRKLKKVKLLPSLCVEHALPDNTRSYFHRHINRGYSRMTLIVNKLTTPADMHFECFGGLRLLSSTFFLFLALLSVPILPSSPLFASVGISLSLLMHIGLSLPFFNFIKQKHLDLDKNYTLTWIGYMKIRLLLLIRTFCWVYGSLSGIWRHTFRDFSYDIKAHRKSPLP